MRRMAAPLPHLRPAATRTLTRRPAAARADAHTNAEHRKNPPGAGAGMARRQRAPTRWRTYSSCGRCHCPLPQRSCGPLRTFAPPTGLPL